MWGDARSVTLTELAGSILGQLGYRVKVFGWRMDASALMTSCDPFNTFGVPLIPVPANIVMPVQLSKLSLQGS